MALDSIQDLRLFIYIHELGSISKAAQMLGITPAVASKRLKRLEHDAGEALFHRSTRTISATGAGLALYEHACAIVAVVDDAQARLEGAGEPSGLLRVTASVAFGRRYLGAILAEFAKRYERVTVEAIFTDRILDMIDDGVDIAIRICQPQAHPSLIMRRLCSGRRLLCATPAYLRTHGHPQTPQDLRKHNCVVLGPYDVWRLEHHNKAETVRVRGSYRSNDGEAVFEAINNDVGIGVVALWHGGRELTNGALVRVLDDYELCPQPSVFAIYHPNQRQVPRVHILLDFIAERLGVTADDAG